MGKCVAVYYNPSNMTDNLDELIPKVYPELRLTQCNLIDYKDERHFVAVCAKLMRHILVDRARRRKNQKHGGAFIRVELDETAGAHSMKPREILQLDEALRTLESIDPRKAQLIELRFFLGLGVEETAKVLGVAPITVIREWNKTRALLRQDLV
jgi:RNA polymerase sigma-70 factor (ECF subfamily)